MAGGGDPSKRRQRGAIDQLPSGSFRVRVYAGVDPLTGRNYYLGETVDTRGDAERVRVRLLSQVDEDRNPRTRATVNQLLDRYLESRRGAFATFGGIDGGSVRAAHPGMVQDRNVGAPQEARRVRRRGSVSGRPAALTRIPDPLAYRARQDGVQAVARRRERSVEVV
jgi:hypothetical protein